MAAAETELEAHLAEFNALREEILSRIRTRVNIGLFSLTCFGTLLSLALSSGRPEVLVAGLFVGAYGMAAYVQHSTRITGIAQYIRTVLRDRIAAASGAGAMLEWEDFFRSDRGEPELEKIHLAARWIANAIAFGGPTLLGLVAAPFCVAGRIKQGIVWHEWVWVICACVLGFGLTVYLVVLLRRWHSMQTASRSLRQSHGGG